MRERAEAHGGRLRVESTGRGTRVVLEIPQDANAD
jgi:signal transduction histidine kinase